MKWVLLPLILVTLLGCHPKEPNKVRRLTTSVGTAEKTVDVACAHWFGGLLCSSEAAVIGRVASVENRPDDIGTPVIWHDYVLDVSSIAGDCEELEGITQFKSSTLNEVQNGTWVIIYVHYYEKKPDLATSGMAPILITGPEDPFAQALLRTGLQWKRFTDQDLGYLRDKRPIDHEEILMRREYFGRPHEKE